VARVSIADDAHNSRGVPARQRIANHAWSAFQAPPHYHRRTYAGGAPRSRRLERADADGASRSGEAALRAARRAAAGSAAASSAGIPQSPGRDVAGAERGVAPRPSPSKTCRNWKPSTSKSISEKGMLGLRGPRRIFRRGAECHGSLIFYMSGVSEPRFTRCRVAVGRSDADTRKCNAWPTACKTGMPSLAGVATRSPATLIQNIVPQLTPAPLPYTDHAYFDTAAFAGARSAAEGAFWRRRSLIVGT
jgi:hypothetical protein